MPETLLLNGPEFGDGVILLDANKYGFLRVAHELKSFVDADKLFGNDVFDAFESARADIREGGNCLAVECNTAAVFHFMRAVEHGMHALAIGVGVVPNTKFPLEYQEWQNVIDQIKSKSNVIDAWGKSAEQINARRFFNKIIADLFSFKDDVRNVTMHARDFYDGPASLSVKIRCEEWFKTLATKVNEGIAPGSVLDRKLFSA